MFDSRLLLSVASLRATFGTDVGGWALIWLVVCVCVCEQRAGCIRFAREIDRMIVIF